MKTKKILFTQFGSFSHINDEVLKKFKIIFPEYEIEVINVKSLLRSMNIIQKFKLLFFTLIKIKSLDELSSKEIQSVIRSTPYFWELSCDLIRKKTKGMDYEFSFQTQSLFNGKIQKCPNYIYTDHTHLVNLTYPDFNKKSLQSLKWIEQEKKLYQEAAGLFTMSNHVRDSLINDYSISPEKIKCVFAGSNIPTNRSKFDENRYHKKRILFVGLDWERKGGPQLLEAFKIVLKTHPDAQLDIVGCNPKIEIQNVNVYGILPIDKVKEYYESSSIFCMPSKREPFGIVYIEAMLNKLPIVALNIGALPDLVEDGKNGFLIEYNDIQRLSEKLIFLLGNPDLCMQMGNFGFKKVHTQYQWENSIMGIRDYILK